MMKTKIALFSIYFLNSLSFSMQSVLPKNEVILFNKCPTLVKIIQDNKLSNYTWYCDYSKINSKKITEEAVLQFVCFVTKNIVTFICENRLPINAEQLSFDYDNKTSVCPFDSQPLKKFNNFLYTAIAKELLSKDHCQKVCFDLYEPKSECVLLSKLNKFINDYLSLKNDEITEAETSSLNVKSVENVKTKPTQSDFKKETVPITTSQAKSFSTDTATPKKQSKPTSNNPDVNSSSTNPGINKFTQDKISIEIQKNDENFKKPEKQSKPYSSTPVMTVKSTVSGSKILEKEEILDDDIKPPKSDDFNEDLIDDEPENPHYVQEPNILKNNYLDLSKKYSPKEPTLEESASRSEIYSGKGFFQAEDSHFFFYFLMVSSVVIIAYLTIHNKNKILAYALEGTSGRRNRRRPNPARYRKLESNLEEAMTSSTSQANESNIVY